MKKGLLALLLLFTFITLVACSKTTTTLTTTAAITRDTSWKTVYDAVDTSPEFLSEVGVCYQVFPISFADSDDDGYGDLNGIAENISYFSETLNVDCIWMNPINPSPSYHKYDVTDYYGIDPQFGTMADFENLIAVADAAGIKILMDLVINHTAFSHPWFVSSRQGDSSTYRDWYVWNTLTNRTAFPSKTGWYLNNGVYYFASFWDQMPELNYDNPLVRTEIKNIATFWLEKGVSGFRIDAAKHIYDTSEYPNGTPTLQENIDFFKEFNAHVKSIDANAFVLGEVYVTSSSYVANYYQGMDSAFNFEFADKLIYSLQSGYDSAAISTLITARSNYQAKRTDYIDSLFLTNHDQDRIIDKLGYDQNKMKLAASIMMTLPGISWIYYGEELGLSGVKPDASIRQPFKWGQGLIDYNTEGKSGGIASWSAYNLSLVGMTEQLLDSGSILNRYITMINLKQASDVLKKGDLQAITNPVNQLMTYTRSYGGVTYLVVHNLSSVNQTITHDITGATVLYESQALGSSAMTFTFSPYSTTIFIVPTASITFQR